VFLEEKIMLVIQAGKLIDGVSAEPLPDMVVLVDGERIVQVGSSAAVHVPPDAEVLDARDKTVMPGLVDAHVHIHTPGGPTDNYALAEAQQLEGTLTLRAWNYGMRSLRAGFTTLRSLGSPAYVDVALRKCIDEGTIDGPRLRVSGQGLSRTGGHMDKPYWSPAVTIYGRTGVCDGPWECRKAARTQIKWGVDLIKLNACGGSAHNLEEPWIQEMTYEEMAAICEEAHWVGKRVAAHTSGGPGLTAALKAGIDSVEHGHWLDQEQVELMAERGTFLVPTLLVNTLSTQPPERDKMEPAVLAWLLKARDDKQGTLDRARAAGVKVAMGTDAGFLVYHGQNAAELEEFVKLGFTPLEAIIAATRTGAECLDMADDIGTVEAGKYADLVVVDGDPLVDITILQDEAKIVQVFKGGKAFK
jgi:imidazolonepropionase-like amidohydrolase